MSDTPITDKLYDCDGPLASSNDILATCAALEIRLNAALKRERAQAEYAEGLVAELRRLQDVVGEADYHCIESVIGSRNEGNR